MRKYKITEIKDLDQDTKAYKFEAVDGEPTDFKPGQFAFIHILDEKGETVVKRPYSIASSPTVPYLEFCIKLVKGELTGKLESMKVGDIVGIDPPGGHLVYNEEPKAGFVAGGAGISPVMGILRYIADKQLEGEFIFFYSVRRKENILYREELEDLQKKNPNIKVVITLTREEGEWEGEKGRLCKDTLIKYLSNPQEFKWWMCGSMKMMKALRECLTEQGVDPKSIKMEGWG